MKISNWLKMRTACRVGVAVAWLAMGAGYASAESGEAGSGERQAFDIPAQDLYSALQEVAAASHYKLLYKTALVAGKRSGEVKGELTRPEAIARALEGTKLTFEITEEAVVLIKEPGERTGLMAKGEGKNKVAEGAGAGSQQDGESKAGAGEGQGEKVELQEIIVTAQKKRERLLDVPGAVTAISGEDLQALQVSDLADLSYYVPGLNVVGTGVPGSRLIIMRGLYDGDQSTGASQAGTYINDLSVGTAMPDTYGPIFGIDLNPYDIDHVEVLKGPQGTLYGANTMGGLIKYSLKQPSLNAFEAKVGTSIESIDHSQSPSWAVRGAVNLPIVADTLALRVSAFDKRDAGYIDNLYTGEKGFNSDREDGGLATLLWKPNDRINVKAMAVVQDVDAASHAMVTYNAATHVLPYGGLAVDSPFLDPTRNYTRIYSLSVDWNLDFATLTSSSGWTRFTADGSNAAFGAGILCDPQILGCPDYPNGDAQATFAFQNYYTKFVQEVRLASPENRRLEWLIGGFFTHETDQYADNIATYTAQLVPLPAADSLYNKLFKDSYKETAGFANLTFKFTDRFDLTGGARYTAYSLEICNPQVGGLIETGVAPTPCQAVPSTGVTLWMANTRYHLSADSMLYARAATGYRPGFGCPTCGPPPELGLNLPGIIKPDQTTNYEVGFKGELFDKRLQIDTDVYRIFWRDMQTSIGGGVGQFLVFPANFGRAVSSGWELSTAFQAATGLTLGATIDYSDGHLTQDLPTFSAKSGDPLLDQLRWSGSLRVDYRRPLSGRYTLLLGGDYRYRDSMSDGYLHSGQSGIAYDTFPPENLVNMYTGLAISNATIRLYATNVFNQIAFESATANGDPSSAGFAYVPVRPRTIGLSLDYNF